MTVLRALTRTILASSSLGAALLLAGCAAPRDRFYTLEARPAAAPAAADRFSAHVLLGVSLPIVVDRREMVLETASDQVTVFEHERWAGPLTDLVSQTLARDLERRRPDVIVAGRGFDRPGAAPISVRVDVIRMTARRGGEAALEAHWRIVQPASAVDVVGGDTFTAPIGSEDFAAVAAAFSACLESLAARLAEKLP